MMQAAISKFTSAQVADAKKVATTLESLAEHLRLNSNFAKALAEDPRANLAANGFGLGEGADQARGLDAGANVNDH